MAVDSPNIRSPLAGVNALCKVSFGVFTVCRGEMVVERIGDDGRGEECVVGICGMTHPFEVELDFSWTPWITCTTLARPAHRGFQDSTFLSKTAWVRRQFR